MRSESGLLLLRWMRLVAVGLALVACSLPVDAAAAQQPNVLLILTDDQRYDSMAAMPSTRALLREEGTRFRAYATTPLCCPSRASIFSGKYAHNHGVTSEAGIHGAGAFDATDTWQHDLYDAHYYTGIVGKYMNGVPTRDAPWFRFRRGLPGDSSEASAARERVAAFLARVEADDERPWALVLALHSPHAPWDVQPSTPPRYPPFDPAPSFFEEILGDKHPSVRAPAALFEPAQAKSAYRGQTAELAAADETVAAVYDSLRASAEGKDTFAIFTSDNGYQYGEHGLTGKKWPYLESVRVPLMLRWPEQVAAGATAPGMAANIDLAPTILEAAGVAPSYVPDGRSLLSAEPRRWLLLEGPDGWPTQLFQTSYDAYVRGGRREYVLWRDGWVEDYRLRVDRWQLDASNFPNAGVEVKIAAARSCVGMSCP